jgi:hypothetical protein
MQTLDELQTDFKAEVIATSLLLASQGNVNKIIIDRLGNNQRSHKKDLYQFYEETSQFDLNIQTVIKTFRQSIYDTIPEGFFHSPTALSGVDKTEEEVITEIQLQRKREKDARMFFKPFEQEASYVEMQALLIELMYEKKVSNNNLLALFEQNWPLLKDLPKDTVLSFIYILPIIYKVRGDKPWIEKCLSFVTGLPISIKENYKRKLIKKGLHTFTFGVSRLGINSKLGGQQYDGVADWDIHIGPVPKKNIGIILPHTGFRQLLDLLCEHFVPANIFLNYIIHSKKETGTILSKQENNALLGYTFFI